MPMVGKISCHLLNQDFWRALNRSIVLLIWSMTMYRSSAGSRNSKLKVKANLHVAVLSWTLSARDNYKYSELLYTKYYIRRACYPEIILLTLLSLLPYCSVQSINGRVSSMGVNSLLSNTNTSNRKMNPFSLFAGWQWQWHWYHTDSDNNSDCVQLVLDLSEWRTICPWNT